MFYITHRLDKRVEMHWNSMSEEIMGKEYKRYECPFCGKKFKMRKDAWRIIIPKEKFNSWKIIINTDLPRYSGILK